MSQASFFCLRPDARFWKFWAIVTAAPTVTWTHTPALASPGQTGCPAPRPSGGRARVKGPATGPTFAHLPWPRCLRPSPCRATPASSSRWGPGMMSVSVVTVNIIRRLTDSGATTSGTPGVSGRRYRWPTRGWTGWPCTSSPPSSSCSISCTGPTIWLLSTCLTSVYFEHPDPVSECFLRIMWHNFPKLFVCQFKQGMIKIITCFEECNMRLESAVFCLANFGLSEKCLK